MQDKLYASPRPCDEALSVSPAVQLAAGWAGVQAGTAGCQPALVIIHGYWANSSFGVFALHYRMKKMSLSIKQPHRATISL